MVSFGGSRPVPFPDAVEEEESYSGTLGCPEAIGTVRVFCNLSLPKSVRGDVVTKRTTPFSQDLLSFLLSSV